VNVLQAMVLTDGEKMLLTPSYHVFRMYRVHQDATLLPTEITAPAYRFGESAVPSLSASASRDKQGRVHVSIVNLEPNRAADITASVAGLRITRVTGEVLTATTMNAMNSFDSSNAIKPMPFRDYKIQGPGVALSVPAKSVVVVELQ
jgi:alpha-L-arabinofuranosidase